MLVTHNIGDDLDTENRVVLIVVADKVHEQVNDLLSIGLEGLRGAWLCRQPVEDLEHAVSELLKVCLVGRVGLEDAWLSEDVDEGGHEPFEKRRVCLAGGVVVKTVAQRCRSVDLEPKL
jgi:hypothetical protein